MGSITQKRPRVTLPQGTIIGVVQNEPDFPQPVECYLGFPYAKAPVGDLRFRLPQPLPPSSSEFDASQYGAAGPGEQLIPPRIPLHHSEDSLSVNIFKPQQGSDKLLPVLVYIHGGAFNRGSSSMQNTASLVAWSEQPMVAVSFNYRIGALGFLPSTMSKEEGITNLGLRDQILLLDWVQQNIHHFGGNKDQVTIMGLSAGAHAIGHHINRYDPQRAPAFHAGIIQSGSPLSRGGARAYNSSVFEAQFGDFLSAAKCPEGLSSADTFNYLRNLPLVAISEAQRSVFKKWGPTFQWAFRPCVDGEVILRSPLESLRTGQYYKVPILTGVTSNEGSLYANRNMSSPEDFTRFLTALLPQLPASDIDALNRLYPDASNGADSIFKEHREGVGAQFTRMEAVFGHFAIIAPARLYASLSSAAQDAPPVYMFQLDVKRHALHGAAHGDNLKYETFEHETTSVSKAQREISGQHHAYLTSFICNQGDPNKLRGSFAHRPHWPAYSSERPVAMIFGKGNEELIGGGEGTSAAEVIDGDSFGDQCHFWWDRTELTLS